MTPQLVVAEGELTVARWQPAVTVPVPDDGKYRALAWGLRALSMAHVRCHNERANAFSTWTAAVEGVWWALSLDDALDDHLGKAMYRPARDNDDCGQVVTGLRWVRHRHAHELVVTGAGGAKRSLFSGPGVFYFSPANRWSKSEDVPAKRDQQPWLRPAYDEHVAGRSLEDTLERATLWFSRVFSACGWASLGVSDGLCKEFQ